MRRVLEWEKRGAELTQAKADMEEELQEAHERIEAEGASQKSLADRVENSLRELEIMKVELNAARQNVEKAEFDKTKVDTVSDLQVHTVIGGKLFTGLSFVEKLFVCLLSANADRASFLRRELPWLYLTAIAYTIQITTSMLFI